jgi:YD repeat-containing protein
VARGCDGRAWSGHLLATDADGRLNRLTLSDINQVSFGFDVHGNLTTLTPPGRLAHPLTYTARDEIASYSPPMLGAENDAVQFAYDADRQSLRADHPDETAARAQYDGAGRLSLLDLVAGQRTYAYDNAGRLGSIVPSNGQALAFTYDGTLRTSASWTGIVSGSVNWTYDNDQRTTSISVDGTNPIFVQYDNDGLATQVGGLSIARWRKLS